MRRRMKLAFVTFLAGLLHQIVVGSPGVDGVDAAAKNFDTIYEEAKLQIVEEKSGIRHNTIIVSDEEIKANKEGSDEVLNTEEVFEDAEKTHKDEIQSEVNKDDEVEEEEIEEYEEEDIYEGELEEENDEILQHDQIPSEFQDSDRFPSGGLEEWRRKKRAVASDSNANGTLISFSLTENQADNGTGNADAAVAGSTFNFEASMDLPSVDNDTNNDISVEIFSIDISGKSSLHICSPEIESIGSQIKFTSSATQDYMTFLQDRLSLFYNKDYPGLVEKVSFAVGDTHTNGKDDAGDENKVRMKFTAVVAATEDLATNKEYFISAGASFGKDNEYIWIGQTSIKALMATGTYTSQVTTATFTKEELMQGESIAIKIEAIVTDPSAPFELEVFSPLGKSDIFDIGSPQVVLGDHLSCNYASSWKRTKFYSPNREHVVKVSFKHGMLLNTDAVHAVTDAGNKVTLTIPLTALKDAKVGDHDLSMGITVGSTQVWSLTKTIKIKAGVKTLGVSTNPTNIQAKLVNVDRKLNPGMAAIFSVSVEVGAGQVATFKITATGASGVVPVGAAIVNPGLCAPFLPDWKVNSVDGNSLTADYGKVVNVGSEKTTVVVEIAFQVQFNVTESQTNVPVQAQIGTQAVTLSSMFDIEYPPAHHEPIEAIGSSSFSGLYEKFEIGLDVKYYIPGSADASELTFAALSDFDVTEYDLRVCRVEVSNIGDGLKCLQHKKNNAFGPSASFRKSNETRKFDDQGHLSLGSCPAYRSLNKDDNSVTISAIFQLPMQDIEPNTDPNENLTVSGVLSSENQTIWVSDKEIEKVESFSSFTSVESGSGGLTDPFFTAYTDQAGSVNNGDAFSIKYIIKPQPKSRGNYALTVTPVSGVSVCLLKVWHIGHNMPCAQKPEGAADKYMQTTVTYQDRFIPGKNVEITFDGLTNWGNSELELDRYVDEDTVNIEIFFKSESLSGSVEIDSTLKYGPSDTDAKKVTFDMSGSDKSTKTDLEVKQGNLINVLGIGTLTQIYPGVSKIVALPLTIKENFYGNLKVTFTNEDHGSQKYVDFCGVFITSVGINMPCVDPRTSFTFGHTFQEDESGSVTYYESVSIEFEICYTKLSANSEDNKLNVELAFRPGKDLEVGTDINIKTELSSPSPSPPPATTFTVTELPDSLKQQFWSPPLPAPTLEISPETWSNLSLEVEVAQLYEVPVYVNVPTGVTTQAEFSVLTPSDNGRAIMTVVDVKFGSDSLSGSNVCCTGSALNLEHVYSPAYSKSENITTFMQTDVVTVDLGFITNAGIAVRQGLSLETNDTMLLIVKVQLTDHPLTAHESIFPVQFSVKQGNTIVVGEKTFLVRRAENADDRKYKEFGDIILSLNTSDTETTYSKRDNDKVDVSAVIQHSDKSKAEATTGKVRVVLPPWLAFSTGSCLTNYTEDGSEGACDVEDDITTDANDVVPITFFDIAFDKGIMFSDIISVNFSLAVDKYDFRKVGTGVFSSAALGAAHCTRSQFAEFPESNETQTMCGQFTGVKILVSAPECYSAIPVAECGVSASTAINEDTSPKNVLTDEETVWSPAIRTGPGWKNYLQFDFGKNTRINELKMWVNSIDRQPSTVTIQASDNAVGWTHVARKDCCQNEQIVKLDSAIACRYTRIVIEETTEPQSASLKPVSIKKVEWGGCFVPETQVQQACSPDVTKMSTDPRLYRHGAFDAENKMFYFCDVQPNLTKMKCFANVEGTSAFIELPGYLGYIHGYSSTKKKMLFRDSSQSNYLASKDGRRMEIFSTAEAADAQEDVVRVVPGKSKSELGSNPVSWPGTKYQADFEGIKYDGKTLVTWSGCCIP